MNLSQPGIIALAPVDGVTDAAFRQMTDEIGKPDVMYTEFVTTEGLFRGRETLLHALDKHKTKTPIIAQFFGPHPKFYRYAFFVAAELGYAGIDVNMGCPDTNIVKKGGGAALLLDLPRAKEIIKVLLESRIEWKNGKRLVDTDLPENMQQKVISMCHSREGGNPVSNQADLPISVKTRIGYHSTQVNEVIPFLIDAGVDRIALHGRTFDARYSGRADWTEIAKANEFTKGTDVSLWGNGDVNSISDAEDKMKTYGVDGVLIARAAFGNPWIFKEYQPTFEERKKAMLYHAQLFLQYRPDLDLRPMRKHLSWYCKGMEGSARLRDHLMKVSTLEDLKKILESV
ncbi:MAG: tRNA-dihydrouridine synthase [Candidatus Roizmanbacteria bacterium]|nr:tRNA-dihydrouridine synthase [Candidatus Roizmanbacteria bacterium]